MKTLLAILALIECRQIADSLLVAEEDTLLIPHWLKVRTSDKYDKLEAPKINESSAVNVSIEFYVENIGNFQVTTMDYDLDIYFIERWTDFRLKHAERDCMTLNDRRLLDRLWIPDLYFANSKTAAYNDVTVPNFAFLVCPNGDIRYSVRISLKMTCMMNLKIYPFDIQRCNVKVLPYGSTTDRIRVKWKESAPIAIDEDIMETDLKLTDSSTSYCNGSYYGKEYSCLIATFTLTRTLSLSLIQIYVPTSFIVIISWISFWIDPSSVPGRVGLAVTTLLTLSTQAAAMTFQLPPVGYAKALDYWLGMCLMFLFGTLIEFTIVNNYTRRWQSAIRKTHILKEEKRQAEMKEPIGAGLSNSLHDENYLFHSARMYQSNTASYMADMNAEDTTTYQQQQGLDPTETVASSIPAVVEPQVVQNGDIWKRRRKSAKGLLTDTTRQILIKTKQKTAGLSTMDDPLVLRKTALKIDKLSRILFPACFVLFAIGYWFLFVVAGEQF